MTSPTIPPASAEEPLYLDPKGKIIHLLRTRRLLDVDSNLAVAGSFDTFAIYANFLKMWRRDRVISRAERHLPQIQSDIAYVLGEQFMDLSPSERDELHGGPATATRGDEGRHNRGADRGGRSERPSRDPERPFAYGRHPNRASGASAPTPAAGREPEAAAVQAPRSPADELNRWLDTPVHQVLRNMRSPLLDDVATRQAPEYEALAVTWAMLSLQRETLTLDELPGAVQQWIEDNVTAREDRAAASPERQALMARIDALFAGVRVAPADVAAARSEGTAVQSAWRSTRGAPPLPAPPPVSAPSTPPAPSTPSAPSEGDAVGPGEPPPDLDEYLLDHVRLEDFAPQPDATQEAGVAPVTAAITPEEPAPLPLIRVRPAVGVPTARAAIPPALVADGMLMAHIQRTMEGIGPSADPWSVAAQAVLQHCSPEERESRLQQWESSEDAADRIFAHAIRTGFGATTAAPLVDGLPPSGFSSPEAV